MGLGFLMGLGRRRIGIRDRLSGGTSGTGDRLAGDRDICLAGDRGRRRDLERFFLPHVRAFTNASFVILE
jgi:hypothetical protein